MRRLILLMSGLAIFSLPAHSAAQTPVKAQAAKFALIQKVGGRCISAEKLAESLVALSSPSSKLAELGEDLASYSRKSANCKAKIVGALMRAMDQPNLDEAQDNKAFFLWVFGGRLLAQVQAVEALDLLIAHIGATDGESPNMPHYPAAKSLINFGPVAIPKLRENLMREQNSGLRRLTAHCIASIGGRDARQTFEEALPKESDKCLSEFMKTILKEFANTRRPNHVVFHSAGMAFDDRYCGQKQ